MIFGVILAYLKNIVNVIFHLYLFTPFAANGHADLCLRMAIHICLHFLLRTATLIFVCAWPFISVYTFCCKWPRWWCLYFISHFVHELYNNYLLILLFHLNPLLHISLPIYFSVFENGKYFQMSSFPELKAERFVSRRNCDTRFLRYPFQTRL